jgi:CRP/FNR family cyclic AMP-dependent transcriptional regulator
VRRPSVEVLALLTKLDDPKRPTAYSAPSSDRRSTEHPQAPAASSAEPQVRSAAGGWMDRTGFDENVDVHHLSRKTTMANYNDYLRRIPLFADLDRSELEQIGRAVTEITVPAGRVLARQGSLGHEMFVIVDGTVEVTRDGVYIADIGPGGFAGEMALLTNARRNSNVVAKTEVRLLVVDGRSFHALLEDVPQIAVKMLPIVASRVDQGHPEPNH